MNLLAALLFLQYSRLMDLTFYYLHIPLILLASLCVLALLAPTMVQSVSSKPGVLFLMFVGWIFLTIPFSIWVGGSIGQAGSVIRIYLLGMMILIFCTTLKDILLVSRSLAFAVTLAATLSFIVGRTEGGRLVMGQGVFADPNEFAATLLLGLPLLVGLVWVTRRYLVRMIGAGFILVVVLALLRTGSRGALIALVASVLFFLWKLPMAQKIVGFIVSLVAGAVIWVCLPEYLQVRFTTLFEEQSDSNIAFAQYTEGDVGSTESRMALLKDGVRMTFKHPIVGVGPGMFPLARWEEGKAEEGANRGWLVTHNSYLQISSETGIMGLVLLVAMLFGGWRALNRSAKLSLDRQHRLTGLHLRIALTGFGIAAMFLSMVYTPTFVILVALCHAFERVAQQAAAPATPSSDILPSVTLPAVPAIPPLPRLNPNAAKPAATPLPVPTPVLTRTPVATPAGTPARTPGGSALRRRMQQSS